MAHTQTYVQVATLPTGQLNDSGIVTTGDTEIGIDGIVNANGGAANALAIAFLGGAAFQSLILLATVNCVVTLTGATVIDGVSTSTVTLTATVIRRVAAITGDVTAISVGANTTASGPAGTIKGNILFNS